MGYRYPISHRKGYTRFCRPTPCSLKNGHVPPKFFSRIFWKILFFLKKWLNKKYLKLQSLQKTLYWLLSPDALSSQNGYVLPQMVFRSFFRKYCFHILDVLPASEVIFSLGIFFEKVIFSKKICTKTFLRDTTIFLGKEGVFPQEWAWSVLSLIVGCIFFTEQFFDNIFWENAENFWVERAPDDKNACNLLLWE